MKIFLLVVGKSKPPYSEVISHYEKLLSRYVKFEVIELKNDEQLVKRVPADCFVALLDAEGDSFTSEEFSRFIGKHRDSAKSLCFVIGGAFGTEFKQYDQLLSLGRMTLPHQLARVLLTEQIYRAHKIIAGEPYHY